jgi:hypothetical protein
MMENIDKAFADLIGGLQLEDTEVARYVRRSNEGLTNDLPELVLENLAELAMIAAALAEQQESPSLYQDTHDQDAYRLLSGGVLAAGAQADALAVATDVFERVWTEEFAMSLLRMLNLLKTALTSSVSTPEELKHLRQVNPGLGQVLDLLAAVQHELLEALM